MGLAVVVAAAAAPPATKIRAVAPIKKILLGVMVASLSPFGMDLCWLAC